MSETNSTYVMSGNKSDFTTKYPSTIYLNPEKQYEAALLSLDMYNSIPNIIKNENNQFKYSSDNGRTWKLVSLDTGSYQLEAINNEIQRIMTVNGDCGDHGLFYIKLTANVSKLTSVIDITHQDYKTDFNVPHSIASVLGFDNE